MVLQIITPQKETFNLPVSLPKDYLGKQVHCLFYTEEEAKTVPINNSTKQKPSDFFGILSKVEGEKFDKHVEEARGGWDRNI